MLAQVSWLSSQHLIRVIRVVLVAQQHSGPFLGDRGRRDTESEALSARGAGLSAAPSVASCSQATAVDALEWTRPCPRPRQNDLEKKAPAARRASAPQPANPNNPHILNQASNPATGSDCHTRVDDPSCSTAPSLGRRASLTVPETGGHVPRAAGDEGLSPPNPTPPNSTRRHRSSYHLDSSHPHNSNHGDPRDASTLSGDSAKPLVSHDPHNVNPQIPRDPVKAAPKRVPRKPATPAKHVPLYDCR
jgi:hypothetical protein